MFLLIYTLFLLLIVTVPDQASVPLDCSNGRPPLQLLDFKYLNFTTWCDTPGQSCFQKAGKCNKQHVCCPNTLKMSSKPLLYDRPTGIQFVRVGDDFRHAYRLYELKLSTKYTTYLRWTFFEETLRDLFEMPKSTFLNAAKNCMENHGIAYTFVPLNATSVTANISAMTVVSRKADSMHNLYVCYIATKREHRRQGLGTRLLQQIVQRAFDERQSGVEYITINVNTLNIVALELYERCGWRCYGYLPGYLDREPHHATNHAYTLVLYLHNVKNVSDLCRSPNAVHIELSDDERSIRNCNRTPAKF